MTRDDVQPVVRRALSEDAERLHLLDVEVWESAAATTEMFEERLANAPRCTFIAEANGGVCGSTSFCLLDYEGFEAAGHTTWYDLTGDGTASTHDTSGKDLFGINLVVSKRAPKDTSTALLLEVVRAGVKAGVRRGLLGARLPGYHKIADQMSIDDYAWAKRDDGLPLDPQIRFYRRMGLRPIRLVKDYFVDPESLDYGMIVEMKNPFFRPAPVRAFGRMLASLPIDLAKVIDRLI